MTNDEMEHDPITEDKLFWFFTTAFILRAIGLLSEEKEARLNDLDPYGWGNWKDHVKNTLEIDEGFVNSVYALCSEFKSRQKTVAFLLRGFGCPAVDQRIAEHPELQE